jgi:hypothetical protein
MTKDSIRTALRPAILAAGLATSTAANAQTDAGSEWISGNVSIEVQDDKSYRSDDPANERNDLYATIEPEITLSLPPVPGLSFTAHGVLEPVVDPEPGDSRAFEDAGFYIEELYAAYAFDRFSVLAGKYDPKFGIAWDQAPGVYGTDLAEDYEVAERIGFAASVAFGADGWGEHALTAGTFFADTTALSDTILLKDRGRTDLADGGVSNTEDFSSYNLVLEGGGFAAAPGLQYHLGYVHQANGVDGADDEDGFAVAAAYPFDLGGGIELTPLVELVWQDNAGAAADTGRTYATGGLALTRGGWNLAAAYTGRDTDVSGAARTDDWQVSFSAGYTFDFGLGVDVGWKRLREDAVETDTVGALATYNYEF